MKNFTKHALFLILGFVLGIGSTFLFDVKKILANEELQNITNHLFASDSSEYSFNRNNAITDEDDRKERITVEDINNSQTLLLEPQLSVEVTSRYLGNGKYSDSISVCTTYLYKSKTVKKYKIYVTANLNNYLPSNDNVSNLCFKPC